MRNWIRGSLRRDRDRHIPPGLPDLHERAVRTDLVDVAALNPDALRRKGRRGNRGGLRSRRSDDGLLNHGRRGLNDDGLLDDDGLCHHGWLRHHRMALRIVPRTKAPPTTPAANPP